MKLIFIRHGDPDYVHDTLTEKGHREAEILSKRVAKWDIKQIFCSPLGRAQATCAYSLKETGRDCITYDWLQEFYYKVKDQQSGEERIAWDLLPSYFAPHDGLHDKDKWTDTDIMSSGNISARASEVYEGFDNLLAEYGYKRNSQGFYDVVEHNDDNLVFFCHFGVTALIVGYLIGVAAPCLWQGMIMQPTALTVVGSEEVVPGQASFRVQTFSDCRHLVEAGEPMSQSGYFTELFEG